jgi:hypothetical protein
MDKCCGKTLGWLDVSKQGEDHKIEIAQCAQCKKFYEGKVGTSIVYVKEEGSSGYKCLSCGSGIVTAEVLHPIHDSLVPLSGSGEVEQELVPFCPECEEKPSERGSIITR